MSRVISCNCESQFSRATLFSGLLHLSCTRSIRRTRKMEPNKSTSLPPKKLRILVVDDEKNIRTTLSLCLEQLGCVVTATATPDRKSTRRNSSNLGISYAVFGLK